MPSSRATPVFIALLACAACSSPSEPADPALTGTAALRAASIYASLGSSSDVVLDISPGGAGTTACPRGGSVRASSIVTSGATTRASLTFAGCAVADNAGQLWSFTSLPKLDVSITSTSTDSTTTLIGNTTGAMRIESSGVRGTVQHCESSAGGLQVYAAAHGAGATDGAGVWAGDRYDVYRNLVAPVIERERVGLRQPDFCLGMALLPARPLHDQARLINISKFSDYC